MQRRADNGREKGRKNKKKRRSRAPKRRFSALQVTRRERMRMRKMIIQQDRKIRKELETNQTKEGRGRRSESGRAYEAYQSVM